jgi:hypothetical protein
MEGGRFSLPAVPPGSYLLVATNGPTRFPGPTSPASVKPESAAMPIEVGREDLVGLRVVTRRGLSAAGSVVAEVGALPTRAPVRIQLVAADPDLAPDGFSLLSIDSAGRFEATDIFGPVLVQPLLPRGWMTSAVTYDGVDVTERPFEFRSDGGPIRVIITDRLTSLGGTVTDDRGRPLTDCDVLIFADDPARWPSGARSVRKTRPDQNGVYKAEGLAPGRFRVVALSHVDVDAMSDPAFLSELRPDSEVVELSTGSPRHLDLRASKGVR